MDLRTPLFSAVALGAGLTLFARSFRDLRLRQLIQNTPTARIRSMPMGLVEISGEAEAGSLVEAPFSRRPCVYWEVDISTGNPKRRSWHVVHRNASGRPFFVRDETGVAMVYPQGAHCRVRRGTEEQFIGIGVPECYAHYMAEQQLGMRHLWRLAALRFRERTLEEGARVYVIGTAMPRPQVAAISDDEVLQATGTEGVRAQRVTSLQKEMSAVIRQGDNERAFLITQESERDLLLMLGVGAIGKLVLGPVLALLGIGGLLLTVSQIQAR